SPRGAVLGNEADLSQQLLVLLLHGRVQHQLRGAAAGAVLLDGVLQPRGGLHGHQSAARQRPRALLQVLKTPPGLLKKPSLGSVTTTATRPARPKPGSLGLVGDTALGRLLGLPRAITGYTVYRVEVPMRDGVILVADHYAPGSSGPAGTLLVRGPYGRAFPFSQAYARLHAARGYHVVLQSVRGTFGSGGEFDPMVNEAADGADTVVWLREQPWFTGRFATVGVSYLGFTQWALLHNPPPELAAAVITVGPHDFNASVWGTGSFAVNDFLGWSDLVSHQEDPGRIKAGIRQLRAPRRVAQAVAEVPIGAAARTLLGTGAPWFESWIEHPEQDDPFWNSLRCGEALDRVQVPVLLLGGW